MYFYSAEVDAVSGLVVRVPGYRSRGPGFDFLRSSESGTGPHSLVSITEELLERKVAALGLEN
jgi:hypothetical protein